MTLIICVGVIAFTVVLVSYIVANHRLEATRSRLRHAETMKEMEVVHDRLILGDEGDKRTKHDLAMARRDLASARSIEAQKAVKDARWG